MNIHYELPPRLKKNQFCAIDLELFGAEKHKLHRKTGEFAACTFTARLDGDIHVFLLDKPYQVAQAFKEIGPDCIPVYHNAKFDINQLRRWADIEPGNVWDTMLIEQILYGGYYDSFSLDDLTRRWLKIYQDKSVRDTFSDTTELTPEQIEYAALDGVYTLQVAEKQLELIKYSRMDAFNVWKNIDMKALWAFLDFQGFRVDVDYWKMLADRHRKLYDEMKASFPFNPNSSKNQVQPWLRSHGAKGIRSADKHTLAKLVNHSNPELAEMAKRLLEYSALKSPTTTYGMRFIEPHMEQEEDYWVINANYRVIGAFTGRTSCSTPNMQNLPVRDFPEFRKPWIARPGHKLIVADYSSQEPRIAAYLSQDKHLIEAFQSQQDIYIETARIAHNKVIDKKDPFRNEMKIDFLAATYGQQPKTEEDAERLDKFFKAFPGLYAWYETQQRKKDYVETVNGRRIWLNPYSNQCPRNALNSPIQGSAADMMKRSIGIMHENWRWDQPFGVVGQVHDEVILDIEEEFVDEVAEFVEDVMISVGEEMCPGIPFETSAKKVSNWLEGK